MNASESGNCAADQNMTSTPHGFAVLWGPVISALLAAAMVASVVYKSSVERRKQPPGPRPWPIIGNFPSLINDFPHRSLQKLSQKFGGLMYLRLGSAPFLVVSSAEVAREILKTHDLTLSERPEGLFAEILSSYRSIVFSPYGAHWRHLRKICISEIFRSARVALYKGYRLEELRVSVKEMLEETKHGEAINLHLWLHNMMFNNMARIIVNKRYFTNDETSRQESREYSELINAIFKQVTTLVISDFFPSLSFISNLQGQEKACRESRKKLLDMFRRVTRLNYRRKCMEEGQSSDHTAGPDFVDTLLSMPSETGDGCLSDETILLLSTDLFVAGIDPAGTTIEWALTEMLQNPYIMQQAQAELDSVVGSNQLVQESHLENLPYLQAILKETYRLHAAAPLTFLRTSSQPLTIQGYSFPAKTRVFFNQWAVHRDPSVYDNPQEFDPARFLKHPEVTVGGGHYQLLPFGTGRRICLGMPLAIQMIAIVLAHLVHSFDWCLPHGEDPKNIDMFEVMGVSNAKRIPLCVIPKPRQSASLY